MVIGGVQKLSLVDFPGKTAAVIFTIGCNMRCGYCHNPELVLPERGAQGIATDAVFQFLESRRGKLDGVVVSGGEPTMHEDLPELATRLKDKGFLVKLDSNGTHPAMLQQMLAAGSLDFIAMDIKAPLERYSEVAARPIDTAAIQESIRTIMDSGLPHEFRTTIVREQLSFADMEKIGQLVRGAQRFALQTFIPAQTLNPQFLHMSAYDAAEMQTLKKTMEQYVDHCVVH